MNTQGQLINNIDKDDIKLNDYEVKDGSTQKEINEIKEVKKINIEIDNILDKDDKQYLSDDEIKKILKESKGYLSDDEVKNILKKYSDGKNVNDLSLLELNEKITYLEYQNFDITRIIDKLNVKVSNLTQEKELIELKYKKDINSVENKKLYSNQESREIALRELVFQDKDYKKIDGNIKECKTTITDLKYKEEENVILKSNFKRIYDIKKPAFVCNVDVGRLSAEEIGQQLKFLRQELKKNINL